MSNKNQQEDISNKILSIDELIEKTSDSQVLENHYKGQIKKLEEKCLGLSETIDKLLTSLESKEEEISHLKAILSKGPSTPGQVISLELTDEELIADIQLRKLKENARVRELTLDEIKKFDLLVKNKRLAQGNATTIEEKKGLPKDVTPNQLVKIASKKLLPPTEE